MKFESWNFDFFKIHESKIKGDVKKQFPEHKKKNLNDLFSHHPKWQLGKLAWHSHKPIGEVTKLAWYWIGD